MVFFEYGLYVIIGILALIGIKELYELFLYSWNEAGGVFTIYFSILFLTLCNIALSKYWYPQYTENSAWIFYGMIIIGILYKLIKTQKRS